MKVKINEYNLKTLKETNIFETSKICKAVRYLEDNLNNLSRNNILKEFRFILDQETPTTPNEFIGGIKGLTKLENGREIERIFTVRIIKEGT